MRCCCCSFFVLVAKNVDAQKSSYIKKQQSSLQKAQLIDPLAKNIHLSQ